VADDSRYISAAESARIDPARAAELYAEHVSRVRERDASAPPAEVMAAEGMRSLTRFPGHLT
jgi:hypothetical protein